MYEWPAWLKKLCRKYGVDLSYFTPKKVGTAAKPKKRDAKAVRKAASKK